MLAGVAGKARGRHLPALLALLALAALGIALGAARAHDRGRAAPGHGDARPRHVGLDAGDRRQAGPAERGARGGAHARALAAARSSGSASISFNTRVEQLSEPTTDRAQVLRALDALEDPGRHRDGRRPAARDQRDPHAGDRRRTARPQRLPGAIVLLSDGASTKGEDPRKVAADAKRYKIPIYAVALGTQDGDAAPEGRRR